MTATINAADVPMGQTLTWTDEYGTERKGVFGECPGGTPSSYELDGSRYFIGAEGYWRWVHPKRPCTIESTPTGEDVETTPTPAEGEGGQT